MGACYSSSGSIVPETETETEAEAEKREKELLKNLRKEREQHGEDVLKNVPKKERTLERCLDEFSRARARDGSWFNGESLYRDAFPFVHKSHLSLDVCRRAVRGAPANLQYVPEKYQTDDICIYAVKHWSPMFKYIKNKTEELCIKLLPYEGMALEYIPEKHRTEEMCITAVRRTPKALQFVKNQTDLICRSALFNHTSVYNQGIAHLAFEYVDARHQTYELCVDVLKICPYMTKHIRGSLWTKLLECEEFSDDQKKRIAIYMNH